MKPRLAVILMIIMSTQVACAAKRGGFEPS